MAVKTGQPFSWPRFGFSQSFWLICLLFGLLSGVSAAEGRFLIVTRAGESIWAEQASKDSELVRYVATEGGAAATLPLAEVEQIIPRARRGQTYTIPAITTILGAIEKVRAKHPKLVKQLKLLQDEWQALEQQLRSAAAGQADENRQEISRVAATFSASAKGPKEFQEALSQVELIKYRDMANTLADELAALLAKMRAETLTVGQQRLAELRAIEKPKLTDFEAYRQLTEGLMGVAADQPTKDTLEGQLNDQRELWLTRLTDAARKGLEKAPSLENYLRAATLLEDAEWRIATPAQRPRVAIARRELQASVAAKVAGLRFGVEGLENVPLLPADLELLKRPTWVLSRGPLPGRETPPMTVILALQDLSQARSDKPINCSFRVLAQRAFGTPVNGLVVALGDRRINFQMPAVTLREGRGEFGVTLSLRDLVPTDDDLAELLAKAKEAGRPDLVLLLSLASWTPPVTETEAPRWALLSAPAAVTVRLMP